MNAPPDPPWDAQLLTRYGHLSELALDRRRYDPPDPGRDAFVDAHLADCPHCSAAYDAVMAFDTGTVLDPGAVWKHRLDPISAHRPARWRRAALWLAPVAAAATLLLVLAPWRADPDTVRLRGGPFDLEVWVHDGADAHRVTTGDTIHPGDRVGFRVKARRAGELLVVGVDERGHVYVCYPQQATVSAPFAATAAPVELPQAMRFDAVPGRERLIALFCDAPIALSEVAATLQRDAPALTMTDALPRLRGDCVQREVVLQKVGDPSGAHP